MSKCTYTPYTYLIGWADLNKFYYGVRYAKECHPDDFWVKYFTSSKYVAEMRSVHGEPDVIQIRKTFDDSKKALDWELKVLKRLKVRLDEKWLNKTESHGFPHLIGEECPSFNRVLTIKQREAISIRQKKYYKTHPNPFLGKTHSDQTKKIISDKMKGTNHTFYGKKRPEHSKKMKVVMKGVSKSEDHKINIGLSHNKSYTCPNCSKQGGRMILRWHFKHCRLTGVWATK